MCGITGLFDLKGRTRGGDNFKVKAMSEAIRHRGPDGSGVENSKCGHTIFAHRMLSIVDVGKSPQPMVFETDDFQVMLTFNGEIYNFIKLRHKLKSEGYVFKTKSDTEVLLQSYLRWGVECVDYFEGDFAFGIYDSREKLLFLARDKLGVKPLFYLFEENRFYFGSEPKALFPVLNGPKRLDNKTFADFFLQKDILTNASAKPGRSFFEGIKSLEPGEILQISVNKPSINIQSYWKPSYKRNNAMTIKQFSEGIRAEVVDSIEQRVPHEVKYGALLSGGLDSSIIVSEILKKHPQPTIATINYTGSYNPDFESAKMFAESHNIEIDAPSLSPTRLLDSVDDLVYAMDEPHDTSRQLGLFHSYKTLANKKCKVAIVGEGSDEFNFGYYYRYPGFYRDIKLIDSKNSFFKACLKRGDFANQWLSPDFRATYPTQDILDDSCRDFQNVPDNIDVLTFMQQYYIHRFLKYRLQVNDRCGMFHGIEARVPYCDHNLVNSFLAVPPQMNIDKQLEKIVLRNAFKGRLADVFLYRKKYAIPENNSIIMHKMIVDRVKKRIPCKSSGIWDILDKSRIIASLNKYESMINLSVNNQDHKGKMYKLTQPLSLTDPPVLGSKHFFFLLSLFSWYEVNFS